MTVKYKVKFEKTHPVPKEGIQLEIGERTARLLAMAYYVDRQMQEGVYKSYAEAAEGIGMTQSRLSQIMSLLNLSCRIQEDVLTGIMMISENHLKRVICHADWKQQEVAVQRI